MPKIADADLEVVTLTLAGEEYEFRIDGESYRIARDLHDWDPVVELPQDEGEEAVEKEDPAAQMQGMTQTEQREHICRQMWLARIKFEPNLTYEQFSAFVDEWMLVDLFDGLQRLQLLHLGSTKEREALEELLDAGKKKAVSLLSGNSKSTSSATSDTSPPASTA